MNPAFQKALDWLTSRTGQHTLAMVASAVAGAAMVNFPVCVPWVLTFGIPVIGIWVKATEEQALRARRFAAGEPPEFLDLPDMKPPSGSGCEWTVRQLWKSPYLNGKRLSCQPGYTTDGASIPRLAWTLIGSPMDVPLLGPALCHDMLYSAELVPDHSTADWMFLEYMQMAGIGWAKRNAVWSAVRMFGWVVWGRHTLESVAAARKLCSVEGVS